MQSTRRGEPQGEARWYFFALQAGAHHERLDARQSPLPRSVQQRRARHARGIYGGGVVRQWPAQSHPSVNNLPTL